MISSTTSRAWLLGAGLVSLLLAAASLDHNARFLEILSDPEHIDSATAHAMMASGRWLSALGLVWALSKSLFIVSDVKKEWRHLVLACIIVATGTLGVAQLIEFTTRRVIESLPAPAVYRAFQLAFYRHLLLTGEVASADTRLPVPPRTSTDKLMVAGFGLALFSDPVAAASHSAYTSFGTQQIAKKKGVLLSRWPEIKANIDKLDDATRKIAQGEVLFDQKYSDYLAASEKVTDGRWFGNIYAREIVLLTGGVAVDPNASKASFAQALATRSTITEYREGAQHYLRLPEYKAQIRDTNDRVLFDSKAGHVIRVRDLPRPFTQEVVMAWYDAKTRAILQDLLPSQSQIKTHPFGVMVAASVLAPPFMIAVAMAGVVLNALGGTLSLLAILLPLQIRQHVVKGILPATAIIAAGIFLATPLCFEGTSFAVAERTAVESYPAVAVLSKFMTIESTLLAIRR